MRTVIADDLIGRHILLSRSFDRASVQVLIELSDEGAKMKPNHSLNRNIKFVPLMVKWDPATKFLDKSITIVNCKLILKNA